MENTIDPHLARVIVYAVSGVMVAAILAFAIVAGIAFSKVTKGAGRSFGLMFQRGNFLRIATVLFVVLAVVLLSALGAMNEGAVAVLSGVAGYVLGGLEKSPEPASDGTDNDA